MNFALDFMERAFLVGRKADSLRIVVRLDKPANYRNLSDFYNENYGSGSMLHLIGDLEKTWTMEHLDQKKAMESAQAFYQAYAASCNDTRTWQERREKVMGNKTKSFLARAAEIQRKEGQDLANFYHAKVKEALFPRRFIEDESIVNGIPASLEGGTHFTGSPEDATILEYLAIGEHIRWRAAHEILGFRYGPKKLEDLKTHPDMVEYDSLDSIVTKHYDWIAVKTTLGMLAKGGKAK